MELLAFYAIWQLRFLGRRHWLNRAGPMPIY